MEVWEKDPWGLYKKQLMMIREVEKQSPQKINLRTYDMYRR